MKPARIVGASITTRLWLGFGIVVIILAAVLLVFLWQFHQASRDVDLVNGAQALEQTAWEMRKSNADIARYLSYYTRDLDRDVARSLSDAESAFSGAALAFSQQARSDEAVGQSQHIDGAYADLRTAADEVVSLADRRLAALLAVRGTAAETDDLMEGMLAAALDDVSSSAREKLEIVLDMRRSLDDISASIDDYMRAPDPAVRQRMLRAGEDFKSLSASFRSLALSPLENSWLQHMESQVENLLDEGTALFGAGDELAGVLARFQASSDEMEAYLAGNVQPLANAQALAAGDSLSGSVSSAGAWLLALGIIAVAAALAAVLIISRRMTRPMQQLVSGASLVASGRIEHRFDRGAGGEFGQLALGLNKMLDNLKRSRDALGESEELAWALLDATHDAVVLTDLRGTILASNEIAAGRFEHSLEQMIDESLYELLSEESAASLKAHVAEVVRSRKPVHYEDEREGKIIEHDVYPVSEHKGEVSRIAFFSRDVTMRKWVEDVTEQLARRNALILESAGEGIFGLDIEGRTTFVNPAAARMHGFKPEELVGKKHHDLVHHSRPDGKLYPPERCPVHATLKDGTVHSNVDDEVFWRKDGSSFQVEYTSTPIIENGKIMGAVITFRDIGDRKRVEKALRESEEKYRFVVESAASLIIWLDQEGTITDCGPRVERFLGYTPEEIIGRRFIDLVPKQDQDGVGEALTAAAREGFEYDRHFRMNMKRGGAVEVSMNAAIARDVKGGYVRTVCMISAVSQRVHSR